MTGSSARRLPPQEGQARQCPTLCTVFKCVDRIAHAHAIQTSRPNQTARASGTSQHNGCAVVFDNRCPAMGQFPIGARTGPQARSSWNTRWGACNRKNEKAFGSIANRPVVWE